MKNLSTAVCDFAFNTYRYGQSAADFNTLDGYLNTAIQEHMGNNYNTNINAANTARLNILGNDGVVGQIWSGTHADLNRVFGAMNQTNNIHYNRQAFAKLAHVFICVASSCALIKSGEKGFTTLICVLAAVSLPLYPILKAINSNRVECMMKHNEEIKTMFSENALRDILNTEISKASSEQSL